MENMAGVFVDPKRLADCRDMIAMDLLELIASAIRAGYTAEEVLVAVSELMAEELEPALDIPRIH